jgi:DnaJ-class molecular chaperone
LLYIEKGIPDGHEFRYKESADEHVGMSAGEILFKVETLPHSVFVRDGNNLKTSVKITLK